HDGLLWARAVLAVIGALGGVLVFVTVLRLTQNRIAATGAGLFALLTPWALHEHSALTPETFIAPLLLVAALMCSRRGRSSLVGGIAVALAVGFKASWILPLIPLIVV